MSSVFPIALPAECGRVLAMTTHGDLLVLACENGVWTWSPGTRKFRHLFYNALAAKEPGHVG